MAKIFGVEVKSVKNIVDHEGCLIHAGDIFLDGKKIGSWADDYMAGPADYNVPDTDYKVLVERANRFYDIYAWNDGKTERDASIFKGDPDILISALIELKEQEKEFKKCLKKGYKSMIVISGPYGQYSYWYINAVYSDWDSRFKQQIDQSKANFPKWCNPKVKYVTGMDDFVVKETVSGFTW